MFSRGRAEGRRAPRPQRKDSRVGIDARVPGPCAPPLPCTREMFIETRVLGRRARPLDGWSIPTPPSDHDGDEGITLRMLLERIVRAEVRAFEQRERARRFVRVLSDTDLAESAARGRIDPGGRPPSGPVDEDRAVGAALQGFEDGLYLVVLDGEEQRDLERRLYLTDRSRVVFLRLTFLAGA